MSARSTLLRLVIFDCDGVIIDSEAIAGRITAASLTELGWPMTAEEAQHRFVGMGLADIMPLVAAAIGRPVPTDWRHDLKRRYVTALAEEVTTVPGAVEAMQALSARGMAWRVASNSSHEEMAVKFGRVGLSDFVAGRLHSYTDVARGKPEPDLFLATAAAQGVQPAECVVIEDSVVGACAAAAAGMDCLAYVPYGDGAALRQTGAVPFASMFDLPRLVDVAAPLQVARSFP